MKKIVAAALLSSAMAAPALAQNTPFYVGALAAPDMVGVLGGYQINQMFSVEGHVAYIDMPGEVSFGGMSYDYDAYQLGVNVVAMLPWKIPQVPALTFFAKGGIERTTIEQTISYPAWWGQASTTYKSNDLDLVAGGGAQYDVTKNFAGRVGVNVVNGYKNYYANAILKF